jgi:hypothetical protein
MNAESLKILAERFCAAPLPDSVCADLCATKQGPGRSGTNLLTVGEAMEVLGHVFPLEQCVPTPPLVVPHPGGHKAEDLVFSAYTRCPCGLGLAYVRGSGGFSYWDCSGILMGTADPKMKHTDKLPFTFYEVKSELQPSAQGATTRP